MRVKWLGPIEADDEAEVCPQCDGDGFADEFSDELCRTCLGTGEVPRLLTHLRLNRA